MKTEVKPLKSEMTIQHVMKGPLFQNNCSTYSIFESVFCCLDLDRDGVINPDSSSDT